MKTYLYKIVHRLSTGLSHAFDDLPDSITYAKTNRSLSILVSMLEDFDHEIIRIDRIVYNHPGYTSDEIDDDINDTDDEGLPF